MEVTDEEFIRRFILHVLPSKFVKIRHYGILSNKNRNTKLQKCKRFTGAIHIKTEASIEKLTGKDIKVCTCCNKGKMATKEKLNAKKLYSTTP
jgi:hypothetical protein